MTNLDNVLKSRDITLSTKVHIVKSMVFPVVMYESESWTIKKAECQIIDGFKLWFWRRLLRLPWTARSNQSIQKEINPEYSLEGLMLKLWVAQLCLTLCDPMDFSMPGFRVLNQLLKRTQTHDHHVGDAIQPSHPLSSPSPPVFSLSHHQGLFHWVSSLHHVAKVLEFQLQHQSFQWILGLTGWISLLTKGLSRVFSNTTVQKHQFFSA